VVRLNLGCGPSIFPNYVNIDIVNTKADIIDDMVVLSKIEICTADLIYSSHSIEHLEHCVLQSALKRWYEVLKENGALIIRCPNGEVWCREWLQATDTRRYGTHLQNPILGLPNSNMRHKNIISKGMLQMYVEEAGFEIVELFETGRRNADLVAILSKGGEDQGTNFTNGSCDLYCRAIKKI
jgi:predicted SAM-dependent methyltransferase